VPAATRQKSSTALFFAAATALAVFAVLGRPLFVEEATGTVWGRLGVKLLDVSVVAVPGVEGVEIVYAACGPFECGQGVESVLLPPQPGAAVDIGWAVLYNIGVRLSDGSYLPAGEVLFKGYLLNVSWSYAVAKGYAFVELVVSDVRVSPSGGPCGGYRLLAPVVSGPRCVLVPRQPPPPLLEVEVDPVYGYDGVLRVSARLSFAARLGAAVLAAAVVALFTHKRRP